MTSDGLAGLRFWMHLVHTGAELAAFAGSVMVPTMGALHEGHASLIRQARRSADQLAAPVLVSIFVNPTQFGEPADLARYPRTLEADARLCEACGADAVFAPAIEEIYPAGTVIRIPDLPPVATQPGLEDAARPGHFAGVCQVVLRLFELAHPRSAVFGEKDWQQLQVVRAMAERERLGVEIIPGPTVREGDGLAMSSRNRFLSPAERTRALSLSRALRGAVRHHSRAEAERAMGQILRESEVAIDYAVIRDARTLLEAPEEGGGGMRALIAGRVGGVRLIDNAPWAPSPG